MTNTIEEVLHRIARQILALNEGTLGDLLPKYKKKMLEFVPTREWEESVIIYFLINGLRIKNIQYEDYLGRASGEAGGEGAALARPRLRLVKKEKPKDEN